MDSIHVFVQKNLGIYIVLLIPDINQPGLFFLPILFLQVGYFLFQQYIELFRRN